MDAPSTTRVRITGGGCAAGFLPACLPGRLTGCPPGWRSFAGAGGFASRRIELSISLGVGSRIPGLLLGAATAAATVSAASFIPRCAAFAGANARCIVHSAQVSVLRLGLLRYKECQCTRVYITSKATSKAVLFTLYNIPVKFARRDFHDMTELV